MIRARFRKSVTRQTRHHDIEGIGRIAAMCGGIREKGNEFVEAVEGVGDPVRERERQRRWPASCLENEMNLGAVDSGAGVMEPVELRLLRAPIETVLPID